MNIEGNVYDETETYMKNKKLHEEITKKVYEGKFSDYRDIDEEEVNNYI